MKLIVQNHVCSILHLRHLRGGIIHVQVGFKSIIVRQGTNLAKDLLQDCTEARHLVINVQNDLQKSTNTLGF